MYAKQKRFTDCAATMVTIGTIHIVRAGNRNNAQLLGEDGGLDGNLVQEFLTIAK